jgi:hypothetical protein
MPLRLSEIKGDNYFFIADRSANETLKNLSFGLEVGKETEEFLKEARGNLCECIGYRQAEKIGSYGELRKAISEEIEHRRPYNEFAERFWEEAIRSAYSESDINPQEEIARDAIYHTLRRTGLIKIYNIIKNSNFDELDITNSVLTGDDFNQLVPLPKDTIEFLTKAMLSSLERQQFIDSLKQKGISNDQLKQIDNALYKSDSFDRAYEEISKVIDVPREKLYAFFLGERDFKTRFKQFAKNIGHELDSQQIEQLKNSLKRLHIGLGGSQPFKLERALRELYEGKREVKYVLGYDYRINYLYYLADLLNKLDLKKCNVEYVHTKLGSIASFIRIHYKPGNCGIPVNILRRLEEITGLDPWRYISKFGVLTSDIKILYPEAEIPDEILGQIYGELLSRSSSYKSRYPCREYILRKSKKQIVDLIGKVGRLNREPEDHIRKHDPKRLTELFGITPIKTLYETKSIWIPQQISNIYQSIDPETLSEEFVKSALGVYLENRGRRRKGRHSWRCDIPFDDEYTVRLLASRVGLGISKGYVFGNQKNCTIKNPEAVGF